jgi:lipopolysaccharide transport system ATP-binding protein
LILGCLEADLAYAIEFDDVSKYFNIRHERPRSFQDLLLHAWHREPLKPVERYWALRNVSFGVGQGEIVGLIGPNGAGKSSILKLTSRIIKPTSGRIEVNGRLSALLELGAGFHPDLTGRENIYLNGSILGMSRTEIDEHFDAIVEFADLQRFIDVPVRHYSSGMYMRLGFSIAVHVNPEILLIDEVLAVGDQAFHGRCLDKIQEMVQEGVSILFVSHDLNTVRALCDRVIWLDSGMVRQEGHADRIVTSYLGDISEDELAHLIESRGRIADGRRLGSYEVRLTDVQLLDSEGQERYVYESGESMTVRMAYQCREPVKRPVFGLAVFRNDGWHINGPNTRFANCSIPEIDGEGHVDYEIDALPLLEGVYQLSVSIYDYELRHAYDSFEKCLTFVVRNQTVKEEFGCVYFPARWEHHCASGSAQKVAHGAAREAGE